MSDFVSGPANTHARSTESKEVLGRFVVTSSFPVGIRENLQEFLIPGGKGAIFSPLLVPWQSRAANFRSNLGDVFLAILGVPSGSKLQGAAPEIWSKRTLLKRVQSLSLSYHVVLLAFVVAPFLPELMVPSSTQAKGRLWQATPLIAPLKSSSASASSPPKGGGSGGERDALRATKGRVPLFSHIQLVPPSARRADQPALAPKPTLIGAPELKVQSPDMPNWGNPVSPIINHSSGPGYGGGIGDGYGGGIGEGGKGPGLGPGEGGGTGNGNNNDGARVSSYAVCVYCPSPQYSQEAVKTKYQGVLTLSVTITADGRVSDVRVIQGLGAGLDEMAVAAVRTWRFRPALDSENKPTSTTVSIEVTFRLY